MRQCRSRAVYLLAAAVLAGAAGEPPALDMAGRARAEAALGEVPGQWVPARRCWAATAKDSDETGCVSVVRGWVVRGGVVPGGEVHLLLQGEGATDCHACGGLAAFAVVAMTGGAWRVVGRPVVEPSGAYGKPNDPDSVVFARLGAQRWGWIESRNGYAQGVLRGRLAVRVMQGGEPVLAGELPGDRDNSGGCDEYGRAHPGCERRVSYTVTAVPDASVPGAAAYSLVLRAKGVLGGPIDRRLRVRFDARRFRYAAPAGWPG